MRLTRFLLLSGAVLAATLLSACAGTTSRPDPATSGSGVTVYGTVDGGIGRTSR